MKKWPSQPSNGPTPRYLRTQLIVTSLHVTLHVRGQRDLSARGILVVAVVIITLQLKKKKITHA